MEVFLKNVPTALTEENLRKELQPFLNILGITDWVADKPNRKPIAFIAFLKPSDAVKFLERHGSVKGHPKLHFLSSAIYAVKSRNKVDQTTLNQIKHECHERQRRQQAPGEHHQYGPALSCLLYEISCGKMVFVPPDLDLKFTPQITHKPKAAYAKFGRENLIVTWNDTTRLEISNHIVQELITDHGSQTLTLVLEVPPKLFTKQASLDPNQNGKWKRETDLPSWTSHSKYVAHCLVYQLIVDDYYSVIKKLKNQDMLMIGHRNVQTNIGKTPETDYASAINSFEGSIQDRKNLLPFSILYQIQKLVWNNYLHPYSACRVLEIAERMAVDAKNQKKPLLLTVDSMEQLLQKIPYPLTGTDPSSVNPQALIDMAVQTELQLRQDDPTRVDEYGRRLPRIHTWVFKAMISPTRIFLLGPHPESWNRVLKKFPDHRDHFLRVSFCDEDGQDLQLAPKVSHQSIYERYRKILADGIRIAGRHFSFLGFSHSSLRSHSTWFLAPFTDMNKERQTRDKILTDLGKFSGIRTPAKCAARIGQAFSETPYFVDLLQTKILTRHIPDVKSADGTRIFSDGVGTVSAEAIKDFWAVLSGQSNTATCFQIRLGGIKGMLALDTTLRGKNICIRRESMMKFPSEDLQLLGICDVASRPLRLVLNRQVIKILEDMGTSSQWFLDLQDDALTFIRGATSTALNTSTFLRYHDVGSAIGLPLFIKQLDQMNIDCRRDIFLKSVVELVVLHELRLLKYKARIPVHKGVTLFGIMDETGFLKEGEIYVTYDKTRGRSRVPIDDTLTDGPVIVTRCPALHPGDVQLVKMRSPPPSHPLRSLKNCVVFSQKGNRDLPSQLSGGDLDGDLYNIIWDPMVFPVRVFSPADYARIPPPTLDRDVTLDDIADFFVEFMRTDILGLIAIRHQIYADIRVFGTSDPDCIRLAEMHSTAVDYSKTGIPVDWQKMPKPPRSRPDFLAPAPPVHMYELGQIGHIAEDSDDNDDDDMGRVKPRYHRSEKILGHLYRGIDEGKIWSQDIQTNISMDGPSVWDQLLGRVRAELQPWGITSYSENHRQQAWKIRQLYEDSILQNMWHFSENPRRCISEAEVFCGTIFGTRGTQSRQQRESSIRLKDEVDRNITWIVKLIREKGVDCIDDVTSQGRETHSGKHDAIRVSWACLEAACEGGSPETTSSLNYEELRSFRVVAASCLLKEIQDLRGANLAYEFGALGIS